MLFVVGNNDQATRNDFSSLIVDEVASSQRGQTGNSMRAREESNWNESKEEEKERNEEEEKHKRVDRNVTTICLLYFRNRYELRIARIILIKNRNLSIEKKKMKRDRLIGDSVEGCINTRINEKNRTTNLFVRPDFIYTSTEIRITNEMIGKIYTKEAGVA